MSGLKNFIIMYNEPKPFQSSLYFFREIPPANLNSISFLLPKSCFHLILVLLRNKELGQTDLLRDEENGSLRCRRKFTRK